jgi:hypothetical protein
MRARINYYLLVKYRPTDHITTVALADAMGATEKHGNWWHLVQADMKTFGCDAEWLALIDDHLADAKPAARQKSIGRRTKTACKAAWQSKLTGEQAQLPDWLNTATLTHLKDTCTLPVHVSDNRGSRWYKTFFSPTCNTPAPYLDTHLPTNHLRALCMFRMGIAQINVTTGGWTKKGENVTPVLGRTCTYCNSKCSRQVVEDAYHVCVECPLYEHARVQLYQYLSTHGFDFTPAVNLHAMYVSMMSVGKPATVRAVGRFLADCMAARDTFLGRADRATAWTTKDRQEQITKWVNTAPTSCSQSLSFLRQTNNCDITLCAPFSSQLPTVASTNSNK